MKRLEATSIYTLGDYYGGVGLRDLCHAVKNRDWKAIDTAAKRLAPLIPKDAVLVPICATNHYTDYIASSIHSLRADTKVSYCLDSRRDGSIYNLKKAGLVPTEKDCMFYVANGAVPQGRLVLIDNVIATGTTVSAALRAIGRDCVVACIAVDYSTYNNNK